MVKLKLVPRQDSSDIIEIRSQTRNRGLAYPTALVHIDAFWSETDSAIHDRLSRGETVTVRLVRSSTDG